MIGRRWVEKQIRSRHRERKRSDHEAEQLDCFGAIAMTKQGAKRRNFERHSNPMLRVWVKLLQAFFKSVYTLEFLTI